MWEQLAPEAAADDKRGCIADMYYCIHMCTCMVQCSLVLGSLVGKALGLESRV